MRTLETENTSAPSFCLTLSSKLFDDNPITSFLDAKYY
jgi:hypothetical protein